MTDQIYQRLREKIDLYALGFPATASGVEIEILEKLYTLAEAELGLNLSIMPETIEVIAGRMKQAPSRLAELLASMVRKGTAFHGKSAEGNSCFSLAPYMRGFADHSAGNMDPGLAKLFAKYEAEGFLGHMQSLPLDTFIRFIPVGEALDSTCAVAPYNKIDDYLRSRKKIAAAPCVCRDIAISLGEKCDLPTKDACYVFDDLADYCVERGQARYLNIDEALELQRGFEKAGLVNMPTNLQSPISLCHCDGEYCVLFRTIKRHSKPADIVASDFYMQVDGDECNGCEACIDRCPMNAIALTDNPVGTVGIDRERCIGCGVCTLPCPVDALNLQEKPDAEKNRKPLEVMEFVDNMAKHRGLPNPLA